MEEGWRDRNKVGEKTFDKQHLHNAEGAVEKTDICVSFIDIRNSSSVERLWMYYFAFMRNKGHDTEQICRKLEKSLNDEKIKIFLEIQIKQNTQQLVSDSITLYSAIERDKKTVPVRCINRLWSALKELAESEKHWENWIYEKIRNIADGRPVLQKIAAVMLGVAIGFSGDFLHDAVQETYFQPKQNAVTIINQFYMQNGNWDIEWNGNRNGTGNSSISPEGNGASLATASDAVRP